MSHQKSKLKPSTSDHEIVAKSHVTLNSHLLWKKRFSIRSILLSSLFLFNDKGIGGLERLNNLPKVTWERLNWDSNSVLSEAAVHLLNHCMSDRRRKDGGSISVGRRGCEAGSGRRKPRGGGHCGVLKPGASLWQGMSCRLLGRS